MKNQILTILFIALATSSAFAGNRINYDVSSLNVLNKVALCPTEFAQLVLDGAFISAGYVEGNLADSIYSFTASKEKLVTGGRDGFGASIPVRELRVEIITSVDSSGLYSTTQCSILNL